MKLKIIIAFTIINVILFSIAGYRGKRNIRELKAIEEKIIEVTKQHTEVRKQQRSIEKEIEDLEILCKQQ